MTPASRQPPRAVVIADQPEIRDGWTRALEATGMEVTCCGGPSAGCVVLEGAERCPVLDRAGLALYHEAVLREPFLSRLRAVRSPAMAIATRDRRRVDGDHEPALSHLITSPST